ncbi:LuxR C-terminal-related transcriptional regulator [Actinacidiphila glaucinigra]|uniref:LuxR C-terminal-related transcriptional regulator n=1 Tax=Actinacidiphila glaucinigra TaxID=235986 RepID=UPI0035D6EF6F
MPEVRLHGRDDEQQHLARFLDRAGHDSPRTLIVSGQAGIGKTRLLRETTHHARQRGLSVHHHSVANLRAPVSADLARNSRTPDDHALLVLDDVEAVTTDELQHLIHTARQVCSPASTLLLARAAKASGIPFEQPLLASPGAPVDRLELAPLTGVAVHDLVRDLIGAPPKAGLLDVVNCANGNPRLIVELVEGLAEEGRIGPAGDLIRLTPRRLPLRVRAAIDDHLRQLSKESVQLLRVGTILGRTFPLSRAATMLGTSTAVLLTALDETMATGLLTLTDDGVSFQQPLIWRAVYESIPAGVRAALDHEAQQHLPEPTPPANAPSAPGRLAKTPTPHATHVGPEDATTTGAIRTLLRTGHVESTALLIRGALDRPHPAREQLTLRRLLTDLLLAGGHGGAVFSGVVFSGLGGSGGGAGGSRFSGGGAAVSGSTGSGSTGSGPAQSGSTASGSGGSGIVGRAPAESWFSDSEFSAPATAGSGLSGSRSEGPGFADSGISNPGATGAGSAGAGSASGKPLEPLVPTAPASPTGVWADTVIGQLARTGSEAGRIAAVTLSGLEWTEGRTAQAIHWGRRAVEHPQTPNAAADRTHPRLALAAKLVALGDLQEATALLRQALPAQPPEENDNAFRIAATLIQATAHLRTGHTDAARQLGRSAFSTASAAALPVLAAWASATLCRTDLLTGDLDAAAEHLARCRDHAAALATVPYPTPHCHWLGLLLHVARNDLPKTMTLLASSPGPLPSLRPLLLTEPGAAAWFVRLSRRVADPKLADTALKTVERLAADNPDAPSVQLSALHARSLYECDPDGISRVAAEHQDAWARACAAKDLTSLLNERQVTPRPPQIPSPPRHRTWPTRDHVGWMAFVDAVPHHRQPAPEPTTDTLSDIERTIAALVASGLTNRQVAQRVHLSPHTVNYYLRRIYRKLGIRSRIELARRLPDTGLGAGSGSEPG